MRFYADLHIHSKYSRATSRDCNLEQLAYWGRKKGLSLLGTGDFTHPAWRGEIREKLTPAEPGLWRLRDELERETQTRLPESCRGPVRFVLQVEISTIYKKAGRTRKVHHVIFAPDLDKAGRMVDALTRIGNLKSDGRPILGLDSRDLLEITLEAGEGCFLVPAHIWTPWFSALGSNSGFDSIDECYGDLAGEVFAAETGLSSGPEMNWRLSALDRFRLISNSDAHSPAKLGREACVFDTEMDYFAVRRALETGKGYGGTIEFFPEEGKYHVDGHRKCGVRLTPRETKECGGKCPVCGKAVTVGVMNRVDALADRPEGTKPAGAAPFRSLIPLAEVLGEILKTGSGSQTVSRAYEALIARLGTELFILEQAPLDEVRRVGSDIVAEALDRMRSRRVIREAGYDGEYGVIRVFGDEELKDRDKGGVLFEMPEQATRGGGRKNRETTDGEVKEEERPANHPPSPRRFGEALAKHTNTEKRKGNVSRRSPPIREEEKERTVREERPAGLFGVLEGLDPEQRAASEIMGRPLAIIAGPGTGKTRTLTHRIAHLIEQGAAGPEQCLALTFTRRAAGEMKERLERLLPGKAERIDVTTFHGFGYAMVARHAGRLGMREGVRVVSERERMGLMEELFKASGRKAERLLRRMGDAATCDGEEAEARRVYKGELRKRSLVDFEDLIQLPVELLAGHPEVAAEYRERYCHVSIDEFQDIDELQYELVKRLAPAGGDICVIGDPDQAIYGFRGTDAKFFQRFAQEFPGARTVRLTKNYRSGRTIVEASGQMIASASPAGGRGLTPVMSDPSRVTIHEAATDRAEAEFAVHTIEQMIGGSTFFSMDSGRADGREEGGFSFSDFAVLYRTDAQADALCEAFERSGMPFQKRSHVCLADSPAVKELVERVKASGEGDLARRLTDAAEGLDEGARGEAGRIIPALQGLAGRHGKLEGFLSELAFGVEVDLWDPRADRVSLLTLHASKGLEFGVVFIAGCEDGILPLRWGGESSDEGTDEERRLLFVGMTRARERLFLCHARKRMWRGKMRETRPSPFLTDIREELLERSKGETVKKKRKAGHEQLSLW